MNSNLNFKIQKFNSHLKRKKILQRKLEMKIDDVAILLDRGGVLPQISACLKFTCNKTK